MSVDTPTTRQPTAVLGYVAGVVVVTLSAALLSWRTFGLPTDPLALAILVTLGVISWLVRESDIGSGINLLFTSVIQLASVVIVGPLGAAIVGGASLLLEIFVRAPVVGVLNIAMTALVGCVGGVVYRVAGGSEHIAQLSGAGLVIDVGLPLIVADLVQCLTNAVVLAGVIAVSRQGNFRSTVVQLVATSGLAYVGYGLIGFLFVILWLPAEVGPFSAVLVLAPLFVARWAFTQYGQEQRAHERTVRSLLVALETKMPDMAGRGDRLADIVVHLGQHLNLPHQLVQSMRYAALLRHVGRVALHTRSVGAGAVIDEATAGADLISDVDFLRDAADLIRARPGAGRNLPAPGTTRLAVEVIEAAARFDALIHEERVPPSAALVLLDESGAVEPPIMDALRWHVDRLAAVAPPALPR